MQLFQILYSIKVQSREWHQNKKILQTEILKILEEGLEELFLRRRIASKHLEFVKNV